jgi:hypothetical protein
MTGACLQAKGLHGSKPRGCVRCCSVLKLACRSCAQASLGTTHGAARFSWALAGSSTFVSVLCPRCGVAEYFFLTLQCMHAGYIQQLHRDDKLARAIHEAKVGHAVCGDRVLAFLDNASWCIPCNPPPLTPSSFTFRWSKGVCARRLQTPRPPGPTPFSCSTCRG